MAVNAGQYPQRWRDLKQQKSGSTERCWGYHGPNIWATTRFWRKGKQKENLFLTSGRNSWNFWSTNEEGVEKFDTHRPDRGKEGQSKAMHNILDVLEQMDGRTGFGRNNKRQILLGATKNRKMWRVMIA